MNLLQQFLAEKEQENDDFQREIARPKITLPISEAILRDAFFADPTAIVQALLPVGGSFPDDVAKFREFETGVGFVDLLLVWPGRVVVVEFKRDVADEAAVAQGLRYTSVFETWVEPGCIALVIAAPKISNGAAAALRGIGALGGHRVVAIGLEVGFTPVATPAYTSLDRFTVAGEQRLKAVAEMSRSRLARSADEQGNA